MLDKFLRGTWVLLVALACSVHLPAQQACGTSEVGGFVAPGDYAGAGPTKPAARMDLLYDMGIRMEECESCSGEGCTWSDALAIPGAVTLDNPFWSQSKWIHTATVSRPGSHWDSVCSSCILTP